MEGSNIIALTESIGAYIEKGARYLGTSHAIVYGITIAMLSVLLFLLHRCKRVQKWTPSYLQSMNDKDFEALIGTLWEKRGCRTIVT